MKRYLGLLYWAALAISLTASAGERYAGPWDLRALQKAPGASWGKATNLVQEVYYEGESFGGKPTRIFAYLGRPEAGKGPFPAMVLVHGGGGTAFPDWASYWAKR